MTLYLLNNFHKVFQQLLMMCLTPPPISYHGSC